MVVAGASTVALLSLVLLFVHAQSGFAQTSPNRAPLAVAKMSIDGGKTYSSKVTVTQGVRVPVRITAGEKGSAGSYDPDGWDTVGKGVSKGGKIEWNNNLWLGEPKFEKTFTNPISPSHADMNLGDKIFTLAPGTYTYKLLKITDAGGLVSNIGEVTLTVIAKPNPTPTPTPSPNAYGTDGYSAYGYSATNSSFTAMITSPATGVSLPKGKNLGITVIGNGSPSCGLWKLKKPDGTTVTLSALDFTSNRLPGNLPLCTK